MKTIRIGAVVGLAMSTFARPAFAQGNSETEASPRVMTYGVESVVSSRFLFRGQAYSERPVSQTTVWAQLGPLSFYGWSNVGLENDPEEKRLSEVDFGVSYALQLDRWTLQPALDRYLYRTSAVDEPSTVEASLRASRDTGPVTLFVEPVLDLQGARGAFFVLFGSSHERSLGGKLGLAGSLFLGWGSARYNEAYAGVSKAAFHHVGLEVSLVHTLSRSLYMEYQLEQTRLLDPDVRRGLRRSYAGRFGVLVGVYWN